MRCVFHIPYECSFRGPRIRRVTRGGGDGEVVQAAVIASTSNLGHGNLE